MQAKVGEGCRHMYAAGEDIQGNRGAGWVILCSLSYDYFRAIILALFFGFALASYDFVRPMIFCDRGAGKSAFLATDRRRQFFILCGLPL
jgi:hypothetical protein